MMWFRRKTKKDADSEVNKTSESEYLLRDEHGPCKHCGAGDKDWCKRDCKAIDMWDWR